MTHPQPLSARRALLAAAFAALAPMASPVRAQGAGAQSAGAQRPAAPAFQAISLLGDTLRTFPLSAATRARYEAQRDSAWRRYQAAPGDLDALVWYGRRLAYLGEVREAIAVYSRGAALAPDNPWIYRHRGHRYLTVRDYPAAIRDLERAAALVAGKPDQVEPDGQPNARNVPIGTLHSNIGYHLALAYYLNGDYAKAAEVARREVEAATNDDRRVSMTHWLYLSLRKLGRTAEAARAVAGMRRDMAVIENDNYHRLMLLYNGTLPVDSLMPPQAGSGIASSGDASTAYGVATWLSVNGREAEAVAIYRGMVASGQWAGFGTMAAEAELARRARGGR
ncbi:MAG: tetratricopeptide repeat protein [Gemmatimonadetes bacterium]|nr:tetratricopeptide repeat protein [Gemmatimonadota bacterium]